jgi:hypothetical protein
MKTLLFGLAFMAALLPTVAQANDKNIHLDLATTMIMDRNNGTNAGLYTYDAQLSKALTKKVSIFGDVAYNYVNRTRGAFVRAADYNGTSADLGAIIQVSPATSLVLFSGSTMDDGVSRVSQPYQIHQTGLTLKVRAF